MHVIFSLNGAPLNSNQLVVVWKPDLVRLKQSGERYLCLHLS